MKYFIKYYDWVCEKDLVIQYDLERSGGTLPQIDEIIEIKYLSLKRRIANIIYSLGIADAGEKRYVSDTATIILESCNLS